MGCFAGRRWVVAVVIFAAVSVVGFAIEKWCRKDMSETTACIRITPVVSGILHGDSNAATTMETYGQFKNTEAGRIAGSKVLNLAGERLAGKGLVFFGGDRDPAAALKGAISDGVLRIVRLRASELIRIQMVTSNPDEAEVIVDAIADAYMTVVGAEQGQRQNQTLAILDEQRRVLREKIEMQGRDISAIQEEYGAGKLSSRQEVMLQTVASLQAEFLEVTKERLAVEANLAMLEKSDAAPADNRDVRAAGSVFANSDPRVQALADQVARYEVLVAERQTQSGENDPETSRLKTVLETLKKRLEELRTKRIEEFEADYRAEIANNHSHAIVEAKAQLARTIEHESKLREELDRHATAATGIGRKQLNLEDMRAELARTRELYGAVTKRISEIEIENRRPARISIVHRASSVSIKRPRKGLAVGMLLAGLVLAVLFLIRCGNRGARNIKTTKIRDILAM